MADFKVEDLIVTVTLKDSGNVELRLDTCGPSAVEAFGSCGFTQKICPKVEGQAAKLAYGVGDLDDLQQLRDALGKVLEAVGSVEKVLTPSASDGEGLEE